MSQTSTQSDLPACCSQCGAVMKSPTALPALAHLVKNEHAKFAIEVALVAQHTIAFVGNEDRFLFGGWCAAHGLTAYVAAPCPCSSFGDPACLCECSEDAVAMYRSQPEWQRAISADIYVRLSRGMHHYQDWDPSRQESDELILSRVARARSAPPVATTLDEPSQRLLQSAISQLHYSQTRVHTILSVATSVARLAQSTVIQPGHLAVAIQLHPGHV